HVVDPLAEVVEDVPRAALGALTVPDHGSELSAVLLAALLVVGEIRAQVDGGESVAQTLPASAAILANQAMALEQHDHDARRAARPTGAAHELIDQHARTEWNLLEHDGHARGLLDVGILAPKKIGLYAAVLDAIEQRARGRLPVASRSPRLLIVGLHRAGE